MTTQTEILKTAKKDQPSASGVTAGFIVTLGVTALVSWVAGVALHQGFGVSVPFMAAWLLLLAFQFLAKTTVQVIAQGWFGVAVEHESRLAGEYALGQAAADELLSSAAFLAMHEKIRGE